MMSEHGELRRSSPNGSRSFKGELRRASSNRDTKAENTENIKTLSDVPTLCCLCTEDLITGLCVECEEYLCDRCSMIHKRGKATRDHTISSVAPPVPSSGEVDDQGTLIPCRFHENLYMCGLCVDCKKLVCSSCSIESHSEHNVVSLENSKRTLQVMCFDAVEMLNGCKQELDRIRRDTCEGKEKLSCVRESAKTELVQRKDTLVKEIHDALEVAHKDIDACFSETGAKYKQLEIDVEVNIQAVQKKIDEMNYVPSSHNIEMMAAALNNFNADAASLYRRCSNCMTRLRHIPTKGVAVFSDHELEDFRKFVKEAMVFCTTEGKLQIPRISNRLSSHEPDSCSSSGVGSALSSFGSTS